MVDKKDKVADGDGVSKPTEVVVRTEDTRGRISNAVSTDSTEGGEVSEVEVDSPEDIWSVCPDLQPFNGVGYISKDGKIEFRGKDAERLNNNIDQLLGTELKAMALSVWENGESVHKSIEVDGRDYIFVVKPVPDHPNICVIFAVDETDKNVIRRLLGVYEGATKVKETEFLARLHHEFRTPLGIVSGYVETLIHDIEKVRDGKEVHERLDKIDEKARELLRKILNMLKCVDIAVLSESKLELCDCSLALMLEDIVLKQGRQAKRKGLRLSYTVGKDVPPIFMVDYEKLRYVICEIIDNAIKFTERGRISVKTELDIYAENKESLPNRAYVKFSIKDTGEGISEENLSRIFEMFSKHEPSLTQSHDGTGISLSICKKYIDMMGGDEIRVRSKLDEGSTFYFTLCLRIPDSEAANEERRKAVLGRDALVEMRHKARLGINDIMKKAALLSATDLSDEQRGMIEGLDESCRVALEKVDVKKSEANEVEATEASK